MKTDLSVVYEVVVSEGSDKQVVMLDGVAGAYPSSFNRAMAYGDGLFDTLAIHEGEPLCLHRHLDRLRSSCPRLGLSVPNMELLENEARMISRHRDKGVLKIILFRVGEARGYRSDGEEDTVRMLQCQPWRVYPPENNSEGVCVRVCQLRLSHQKALAGIKHLNRLEQVMARREWNNPDIAEGLVCDDKGNVIEGTMSNVFLIREGTLSTPVMDLCGVRGIVRDLILEQGREMGLSVQESRIDIDDCLAADAMFLCNSLIGIWPVRRIEDKKEYSMPWPVIRQMQEALVKERSIMPI